MAVRPTPEGFSTVTPGITVRDANRAITFYQQIFGAKELMRMPLPDGKLAHAEIKIGNSIIMLGDENPEWGNRSPESIGGTPVVLHIYVDDVDTVARRAVEAGAKLLIPVADQFYGDRAGRIQDPFGHIWGIATHTEDVAPADMQRRFDEWMSKAGGS